MIRIKGPEEMAGMRRAGQLAARILDLLAPRIRAGISTARINDLAVDLIEKNRALSAALGYHGFPGSICTSINSVVCHGIPSPADILRDGDIVNVDITVVLGGWHGDTSRTFLIGAVAEEARRLVERTYAAMWRGIDAVKPGRPFGDIGAAIQDFILPFGYAIVEDYGGHGIGRDFHEDPHIYHFRTNSREKMRPGMTFTVEPMINMGPDPRVITSSDDGWTVTTSDGRLSAQFEHTVAVTAAGYEVLTLSQDEKRS